MYLAHYESYKANQARFCLEKLREVQAFQKRHIRILRDPFCIRNIHQSVGIQVGDTNGLICIQCKAFCYRYLDMNRSRRVLLCLLSGVRCSLV